MKKYVKTDWVLLLDSDIIVPNYISSMDITNFDKDALYGVPRIVYKTQKDWVNKENEYYDFWKFMGFSNYLILKVKIFQKTIMDTMKILIMQMAVIIIFLENFPKKPVKLLRNSSLRTLC